MTAGEGKKKSSDLLVALRGADDVRGFLTDAGFDIERVVRNILGDTRGVGALLVGSVAEGYQTASSDVDILLVTYADREDVDVSSRLLIESGSSLELLSYASGIEVNTEIVCRDDHDALADRLDRLAGSVALGQSLSKMPMIDNYSLRFLHRLRTGVILFGDDVVDQFRSDFHVHALPLYLSIKYLVLARESLEDAQAASAETPGLVEFICRDVIEHLVLATAASEGFTSQSRRFVLDWLHRDAPTGVARDRLERLRVLLLDQRARDSGAKSALVAECSDQYAAVLDLLLADPVRRSTIESIFSRISYA